MEASGPRWSAYCYGHVMPEIALFHSILGVTRGVTLAAERLRAAGHVVHVLNLYEHGTTFDDYSAASDYVERIGSYPELLRRARVSVHHLTTRIVYAGFSNGGAAAEYLAAIRPGALGAILMHASMPLSVLDGAGEQPVRVWPRSVPVQVHYSVSDPARNQEWIESFAESAHLSCAPYAFFEYSKGGHLFADPDRDDEYDEGAAEQMWRRVHDFLAEIDRHVARAS